MAEFLSLLAFWQSRILPPTDPGTLIDILLRWIHFVAGITWIGLLYFFNLVNVPAMKQFDAPTKGKYVPVVVNSALWWFRWSAVVTVLAGFIYWALLLSKEPPESIGQPGSQMGGVMGIWVLTVGVAWFINYFLIKKVPAVAKNGYVVAVIVTALAAAILYVMVYCAMTYEGASNRTISIGVGGGYGLFMLLNVWGIIWPNNKRVIAWTKENAEKGTAIPAEAAALGRQAFLASRSNAWLSLPMLFFMAAASHFPIFVGG